MNAFANIARLSSGKKQERILARHHLEAAKNVEALLVLWRG